MYGWNLERRKVGGVEGGEGASMLVPGAAHLYLEIWSSERICAGDRYEQSLCQLMCVPENNTLFGPFSIPCQETPQSKGPSESQRRKHKPYNHC